MNSLKNIFLSIAVMCIGLVPVLAVVQVFNGGIAFAQTAPTTAPTTIDGGLGCGANLVATPDGDCDVATGSQENVQNTVNWIINLFSWIVGIVCVIMIIYGGFRYVTSGGNDANVTSAKNTIMYAIIGLVIVALAQVIVKFVINKTNAVV